MDSFIFLSLVLGGGVCSIVCYHIGVRDGKRQAIRATIRLIRGRRR